MNWKDKITITYFRRYCDKSTSDVSIHQGIKVFVYMIFIKSSMNMRYLLVKTQTIRDDKNQGD